MWGMTLQKQVLVPIFQGTFTGRLEVVEPKRIMAAQIYGLHSPPKTIIHVSHRTSQRPRQVKKLGNGDWTRVARRSQLGLVSQKGGPAFSP